MYLTLRTIYANKKLVVWVMKWWYQPPRNKWKVDKKWPNWEMSNHKNISGVSLNYTHKNWFIRCVPFLTFMFTCCFLHYSLKYLHHLLISNTWNFTIYILYVVIYIMHIFILRAQVVILKWAKKRMNTDKTVLSIYSLRSILSWCKCTYIYKYSSSQQVLVCSNLS